MFESVKSCAHGCVRRHAYKRRSARSCSCPASGVGVLSVFDRIFPKQLDNHYRSHQLAAWLLALFLLVKTFASVTQIGLNPFWTSRDILQGVEKVPFDTFSATAANAALVLFGWWGVTALLSTSPSLLAVIRYRSMDRVGLSTVGFQPHRTAIARRQLLLPGCSVRAPRDASRSLSCCGLGMSMMAPQGQRVLEESGR